MPCIICPAGRKIQSHSVQPLLLCCSTRSLSGHSSRTCSIIQALDWRTGTQHVTHNEGAYDTNLQPSAQIIIGCWRVMNLNDLTWVGREKLRLGLESLLRRFTLVPLCKFDALLICFYTVRKEGSHTNMGTAFMFYACESATTAMFLTIIQKAV